MIIRPNLILFHRSADGKWIAFAALLAAATGKRVLSADSLNSGPCASSRSLPRLYRTRHSTLLIQSCNNDYVENEAWVRTKDPVGRKDPVDFFIRVLETSLWTRRAPT